MTIRKTVSSLLLLATVAVAFLWITGRVPTATGLLDQHFRPQPISAGTSFVHWPSVSEATTILAHGSFRQIATLIAGVLFQIVFNLWILKIMFVASLAVSEGRAQRDRSAVDSA